MPRSRTISQIQFVICSTSSFPKPLVVTAGVPNLIPEVTNGDWGSSGTAFLFTVIFAFPKALGKANITVNKNAVPDDPQSPFVTSGIRLGTPAVTTRGFGKDEVEQMTNWICDIVLDLGNTDKINLIKDQVVQLCSKFPVYK